MMDNLKDVIKEIVGYRKELKLKDLTDNCILETSARIFISNNIQASKEAYRNRYDEPRKDFKEHKAEMKNPNAPATDKQKDILREMEFNGDLDSLTKIEAFTLIKEKFEEQRKAKNGDK